jgi:hypothetical protein
VKWWLLALPHALVIAVLAGGFSTGWIGTSNAWRYDAPSLNARLVACAAVALLFSGHYPRDIFRLRARHQPLDAARRRLRRAHARRIPAVRLSP